MSGQSSSYRDIDERCSKVNSRSENLVDLSNGCLVLQVDRGVEVGDLGVDGLADHLTLAGVHNGSHL